jgi:hypothetical protein
MAGSISPAIPERKQSSQQNLQRSSAQTLAPNPACQSTKIGRQEQTSTDFKLFRDAVDVGEDGELNPGQDGT